MGMFVPLRTFIGAVRLSFVAIAPGDSEQWICRAVRDNINAGHNRLLR